MIAKKYSEVLFIAIMGLGMSLIMTLLSENNLPSSGRYCTYCKYTKNFNNLAF